MTPYEVIITRKEAEAALAEFKPYLRKSVLVFEKWRRSISKSE